MDFIFNCRTNYCSFSVQMDKSCYYKEYLFPPESFRQTELHLVHQPRLPSHPTQHMRAGRLQETPSSNRRSPSPQLDIDDVDVDANLSSTFAREAFPPSGSSTSSTISNLIKPFMPTPLAPSPADIERRTRLGHKTCGFCKTLKAPADFPAAQQHVELPVYQCTSCIEKYTVCPSCTNGKGPHGSFLRKEYAAHKKSHLELASASASSSSGSRTSSSSASPSSSSSTRPQRQAKLDTAARALSNIPDNASAKKPGTNAFTGKPKAASPSAALAAAGTSEVVTAPVLAPAPAASTSDDGSNDFGNDDDDDDDADALPVGYVCLRCRKRHLSKALFDMHTSKCGKVMHKCKQCADTFFTEEDLSTHLVEVHPPRTYIAFDPTDERCFEQDEALIEKFIEYKVFNSKHGQMIPQAVLAFNDLKEGAFVGFKMCAEENYPAFLTRLRRRMYDCYFALQLDCREAATSREELLHFICGAMEEHHKIKKPTQSLFAFEMLQRNISPRSAVKNAEGGGRGAETEQGNKKRGPEEKEEGSGKKSKA
jgi:hypothetical protein